MNRRRLALLMMLVLTSLAVRGATELERAALKGIHAYRVVIEPLDSDSVGFSTDDLRTMTELALRRAGIKIIDNASIPWVYVNLTTVRSPQGLIGYTVSVDVNSMVRILHNNHLTSATVWSGRSGITVIGSFGYPASVRNNVTRLLDQLVNDHLAANSK